MDISTNELKTMKSKQLKRIIQEVIRNIQEDAAADKVAQDAEKRAVDAKIVALSKKKAELSKGPTSTLEEMEIDEMARAPKGFKLTNPNMDMAPYTTQRVSGVPLSDILEFFKENPGTEKVQIQSQFKFVRPQISNALVNSLLTAGVLTQLGAGGEEEPTVQPGETPVAHKPSADDMFTGSSEDPLSVYFDNEPNADGSEDFNDEEEPTGLEPKDVMGTSNISDEDYENWLKYDNLKNRLNSTKTNINKLKRGSTSGVRDLGDKPSTELLRLNDLKISLEDRIEDLVSNSEYLQQKVKDEASKVYKKPIIEPEEDEEDVEEEPLDEWTIRKMQFYAGIIK